MSRSIEDYFSFQVFLIVLREVLESAIIISVLLAFIHQSFIAKDTSPKERETSRRVYNSIGTESVESIVSFLPGQTSKEEDNTNLSLYKYLKLQIWVGGLLGFTVCLLIGSFILSVFYILGNDLWSFTEHYWEGTFSILASIIISIMGIKILRVNKMQEKWKYKLSMLIKDSDYLNKVAKHRHNRETTNSLSAKVSIWSEKYSMFILPFITTLREGMEAIVFIGGIGINDNTSFSVIINSLILAVMVGSSIGVILYRSGNTLSLQWFLIVSTGFLYLVAAGLFSKGVWNFELQRFIDLCDGFDVSETGNGPGSYDISNSVWHVNCCNGELQDDGPFWMMFTAVFGWTNSATYGSVISYNIYWLVVIIIFVSLLYEEKYGRLPIIPIKWQQKRLTKRKRGYQLWSTPDTNLDTISRESIESINSETPLNS